MIFYLTVNDLPSGIYSGQVIDVVNFINAELKAGIKLIAFISVRNFRVNKLRIKKELPSAIVLPMVPGLARWKANGILLKIVCMLYRPQSIIGRSVLATQLALQTNCKVIYDGRGAISEEWHEYNVVENKELQAQIYELEKECVLKSDFRLAVSNQLLKHWQKVFNYNKTDHVIIPCTINSVFENLELNHKTTTEARKKLGIEETAVVCVYSGSLAGWQSFDLMGEFIRAFLKNSENSCMVFLSHGDKNIQSLKNEFPSRVICISVSPQEVPAYLLAADYGLLIREESVTNKVASPVKFAEYLACGLKVIISQHLGDYTEFVINNNCGSLMHSTNNFAKPTLADKNEIRGLISNFKKQNYIREYAYLTGIKQINKDAKN